MLEVTRSSVSWRDVVNIIAFAQGLFNRCVSVMSSGGSYLSMHGLLPRIGGNFTIPQHIELEFQVLIYMYLNFKPKVPSTVLASMITVMKNYENSTISVGNTTCMSSGGSYMSMHGLLPRIGGNFTTTQQIELEYQVLIYMYLNLKSTMSSSVFASMIKDMKNYENSISAGTMTCFGYSALGFGETNPESGRCTRTDGKTWRCKRMALANWNRCEKHMKQNSNRSKNSVPKKNRSTAKAKTDISSNSRTIKKQHTGNLQQNIAHSNSKTNKMLESEENAAKGDHVGGSKGLPKLTSEPNSSNPMLPTPPMQLNPVDGTPSGLNVNTNTTQIPSSNSILQLREKALGSIIDSEYSTMWADVEGILDLPPIEPAKDYVNMECCIPALNLMTVDHGRQETGRYDEYMNGFCDGFLASEPGDGYLASELENSSYQI